ncbi:uncharacterized protein LOC111873799 isoform X2 [Cryptotermes secundus]|nr:uncharacterized protein LOC111873799 isoform X2 [Cryptotermes secundus]
MIPLIMLCCVALAAARPSGFQSVSYSVPSAFVASPVSISSQYHTQDSLGQYSYGYNAGSSAKAETKTLDGVTRGGYSYVDGNGIVQTTNYIADDINGFQVAATNLPTHVAYDTPEVSAAKVAHSVAYNKAAYAAAASPDVGESVVVSAPVVSSYVASSPAVSIVKEVPSNAFSYSTVTASPSVAVVPTVTPLVNAVKDVPSKAFSYSTVETSPSVAVAPALTAYPVVTLIREAPSKTFSYSTVAAPPAVSLVSAPAAVKYSVAAEEAPVVPFLGVKPVTAAAYSVPSAIVTSTSHQYHAQDALGQYSYGYSGGPSAKVETKTLDGVTRGGYSYVDANGIIQSASYVADDVNGFRVAATNIPVGPNTPVVHNVLVSPVVSGNQVVADTPEVVAAKAAHFAAHSAVKHRDNLGY